MVVGLENHTLLIAKDGTERPIDDSAAPIRNPKGEVAGVVLVFRDVTERRDQENSLSDALKYSQSIIATLREPFITLDKDLRVRTANDAYYRIFQTSKGETEGQLFTELEKVNGLAQRLEYVVADHHSIKDFEISLGRATSRDARRERLCDQPAWNRQRVHRAIAFGRDSFGGIRVTHTKRPRVKKPIVVCAGRGRQCRCCSIADRTSESQRA